MSKSAPLVELPEGADMCCSGTLSLGASFLNLIQGDGVPFGTTAHAKSWGRRSLVETSNSLLAGKYIALSRSYTRLMGLKNRRFITAFMIAGLNRFIELGWRAVQVEMERLAAIAKANAKKTRATRRHDTLQSNGVPPVPTPATTPAGADAGRVVPTAQRLGTSPPARL